MKRRRIDGAFIDCTVRPAARLGVQGERQGRPPRCGHGVRRCAWQRRLAIDGSLNQYWGAPVEALAPPTTPTGSGKLAPPDGRVTPGPRTWAGL